MCLCHFSETKNSNSGLMFFYLTSNQQLGSVRTMLSLEGRLDDEHQIILNILDVSSL